MMDLRFNLLKDKIIPSKPRLGIYFGKDKVSAVETCGRRILRQASLNLPKDVGQFLNKGSYPEEDLKAWIDLLKAFIQDNRFGAKEAILGLSLKDLFIRGFQMPLLARREIDSGINFEVRKYLPFRAEELVYDYQYRLNKALSKTDVFYAAANRNNFDKYLSLFKGSGILVRTVESAGLGLFRLLLCTGQFDPQQAIMIITLQEKTVLEFSVFNQGFPCFNREVKLSADLPEALAQEGASLERIGSEIRIFLDYLKRQFSINSLDRIIFVAAELELDLILALNKSLGLNIQTLESSGEPWLRSLPDLDGFKAYAASLKGRERINLKVDLCRRLSRKTVILPREKATLSAGPAGVDFNLLKRPLILGIFLIGITYCLTLPEQLSAAAQMERISSESQKTLPEELKGLEAKAIRAKVTRERKRLALIKELVSSRAYLSPLLNLLPRSVRKGLWIEHLDISFKDKYPRLSLEGISCLQDPEKDLAAVNNFWSGLRNNRDLPVGLNDLEIVSVRADERGANKVSLFEISNVKAKI